MVSHTRRQAAAASGAFALLKRGYSVRRFGRKKCHGVFLEALRTVSADADAHGRRITWRRELQFRAHGLQRRPLQLLGPPPPHTDQPKHLHPHEDDLVGACGVLGDKCSVYTKESSVTNGCVPADKGVEGLICPCCRRLFGTPAALLEHEDHCVGFTGVPSPAVPRRAHSGLWERSADADADVGILLCRDRVLARLRWWRMQRWLRRVAGSSLDPEAEPLLVYCSQLHGASLPTLQERWAAATNTRTDKEAAGSMPALALILVQTLAGDIIGAFTAGNLRRKTFCSRSGPSASLFAVFRFSRSDRSTDFFPFDATAMNADDNDEKHTSRQAGYTLMVTKKELVVGGGVGMGEAIYLKENLQSGHSRACSVFGSPPLVEGEEGKFEVAAMEVYLACRR